ncbi:phage minor capsid protein [Saccharopolyspora shandongensis]|uniref:phage minor capsid protein n=1 Tax=Saccharopolyspora shandongensis TaxID=418495 RepID=UPI0033E93756
MAWSPTPDRDPGEVIEQLARDILALFTQTEARLLGEIARRARAGQDTPAWAAEKAAAAREMRLAAERILAQLSGQAGQAAAEALLAAYQAGAARALAQLYALGALDADQLAHLRDVIPGMDAATLLAADLTSRLEAMFLRILRWTQDAFQTAIAAAAPAQLLGTATTHTAQRSAWDRLAADGVTGFVDRAGRTWNLASYVEMATRTATGRAWNDGHLARMEQADIDLVTVSRTTDGCALCSRWEGRILARSGETGDHSVDNELTGKPMTVDIAATVDDARAQGLMHPNCRHTFIPYIPGVTVLPEPVEHDQDAENEREHLRALERKVRREKRKEAAALDDTAARLARAKIRDLQAEIRQHVAETGLNRKRYREQINLGHGDMRAAERRRAEVAEQVAEGTAEQARLDAVATEQAQRREQERLAAEQAEREAAEAEAREAEAREAEALPDFTEFSDEQLDAGIGDYAEDPEALDALLAEMDRRQAEHDAADERRERQRQQRQQRREEQQRAQWERFEQLLAEGWDEQDAEAEATGRSVEAIRRRDAITRLRGEGYSGRGFDELARASFRDQVYAAYIAAEAATNGYLLSNEAEAAGIEPLSLFTGPAARARRWASDELLEWWDENGRLTFEEWVAELLGDSRRARDARYRSGGETWLQ